jgi:potassium-dependent mechanosensitive channel
MMRFALILLALGVTAPVLPAQNFLDFFKVQGHASPGEERSEEEASTQLEWAKGRLAEASGALEGFDRAAFEVRLEAAGLPKDQASEMEEALGVVKQSYEGAVAALEAVLSNRKSLDAAASEPPPPSPTDHQEVEALRERIGELRTLLSSQTAQIELQEPVLLQTRRAHDEAAKALRRAQETLDTSEPSDRPRAAVSAQIAEQDFEAKAAQAFLGAWRLYADKLEREQTALRLRAAEKVLDESGLDTLFDRTRATAAIEALGSPREDAEADLAKARERAEEFSQAAAGLRDNEADAGAARTTMAGAASIAARTVRGYESLLAVLDAREQCWQAVLRVLDDPGATQPLVEARTLADTILDNLKPWFEFQKQSERDSSRRLSEIEATAAPKTAAGRGALESLAGAARQRDRQLRDLGIQSDLLLDLASRLATESRLRLAEASPAAKATSLLKNLGETARTLWQTEVFTVKTMVLTFDGSPVERERSITLGKILIAAGITLLALLLARLAAKWIGHKLRARRSPDVAKVQMIERGVFIALSALIVLTALNWLQIPLTAFAFLGGALAIGVGFGVQTLMNNFISGLILTAERRIKVGDIIEVEGRRGMVLNLGTRCSTVRLFDGVELLVPNSHFLEKSVTNWTLADPHHRFDFVVGVAYGSDTRAVLDLLKGCLDKQPELMSHPPAEVFFEEFGDSALNFRLYYWVDMRTCDARQVGSELRLRIDARCREAGIEIAFPQRDVHLHAAKPIRVALEP